MKEASGASRPPRREARALRAGAERRARGQDNGPDNKVFIKSVVAGGAPPARAPPIRRPQAGPCVVFSTPCQVVVA